MTPYFVFDFNNMKNCLMCQLYLSKLFSGFVCKFVQVSKLITLSVIIKRILELHRKKKYDPCNRFCDNRSGFFSAHFLLICTFLSTVTFMEKYVFTAGFVMFYILIHLKGHLHFFNVSGV